MSRPGDTRLPGGSCALAILVAILAHVPCGATEFERLTRLSERIVWATVVAAGKGEESLPDGKTIPLGVKDPATGLVFTPCRIRVEACVFDEHDACELGEGEIWVPGGTVREWVDGRSELRTWEVAGATATPPRPGTQVALFLKKLPKGTYLLLNSPSAALTLQAETETLQGLRDRVASIRRSLPVSP